MALTLHYPSSALAHPHPPVMPSRKRVRRNATSVMAGDFDARPPRDVLTSLLNGVAPYTPMYRIDDDEVRRQRKKEKKERERERKRERLVAMNLGLHAERLDAEDVSDVVDASRPMSISAPLPVPSTSSSTLPANWSARPAIHIATMYRSMSVTPPPFSSPNAMLPSTPASTPGPSESSSTSRTSSKRPRTPNDDEEIVVHKQRKQRAAVRKGWKGWVEGSPPPSEKLINLDVVPVLQERRTRSGKNFDAIGVGKDGWI